MVSGWEDLGPTAAILKSGVPASFVFKYVRVVAPPILTAVDLAEPMTAPILINVLSEEDRHITRSLSFLLAQLLSRPPLQLMMDVGEQNGLEAWRLLVR